MSDEVKAAAIVAAGIVVAAIAGTLILTTNSPFSRCVAAEKRMHERASKRGYEQNTSAEFVCAYATQNVRR
jgi:hypothetical protein